MNKRVICSLVFVLLSCIFIGSYPVCAETGYVSDMLILTMREGPGKEYNVLRTLKSNTSVQIIEEREEYYKVSLSSGDKGWVEKQYITFEVPDTMIIAQLKQKTAELEKINQELGMDSGQMVQKIEKERQGLKARIKFLESSLAKETKQNRSLALEIEQARNKYETLLKDSKNIVRIQKENKKLKQENSIFSADLKIYENENDQLMKTGFIKWFLAGAGVLFAGWVIGRSFSGRTQRSGGLLI